MSGVQAGSWPRRVLYVESNEDGTVGGSHKVLHDLVTRLSPDFHPTVLFYQDNSWADRLRDAGVDVRTWDEFREGERARFLQGGKLSTAFTLASAIRHRRKFMEEGRFDLIHLNGSPYVGYDDWLPASRLLGLPCATYVHGGEGPPSNRLQAFGMRRFDAYFCVSERLRSFLITSGLDPKKLLLTYPGLDFREIDRRTFRPAQEVRGEFGLSPDQLLIVMVGNIRHWKGQHVVVEALAGLTPEERQGVRCLFVGDTDRGSAEYEARLLEAVREYGLTDTAVFTGRRDDVPDLLEAADIAVHASVDPEPFGLVVLEAMVHGCATVAADEGGPVEMITEDSGLTFDPSDPSQLTRALRTLIRDPGLRSRLGARAKERARYFDQDRHVAIIEDYYRSVFCDVAARTQGA